tara:strand:- start:1242 stop:1508 length:267 start_codon:yes stop_codon:yes gene_type:complete
MVLQKPTKKIGLFWVIVMPSDTGASETAAIGKHCVDAVAKSIATKGLTKVHARDELEAAVILYAAGGPQVAWERKPRTGKNHMAQGSA